MNANEMVIISRLATLYEDHGVENPLDNAEHDIRELKRGAPELWRRIYDSEMSDRAIGDWAYDFFMREIQSGMSLKNFAADELEALDKVSTNIPHPVREAIRMNTFKKHPRLQESAPRTYRGFKIAPIDATHLGYWIPGPGGGRRGKGRKMRVFYIYSPEDSDRPIKSVDSMRHAIEYIDNYLGDAPSEMSEHRVADFNTLDDLVEHARGEGATHVLHIDDEIHLYFKRRDGQYEKAEIWQKDGYWHTQGPGSRAVVRRPPPGAQPIEGEHEREEGPHSWKPEMRAARRRPEKRHEQSFAGYDFTSGPEGTTIRRDRIPQPTPGKDYGASPIGDGTFRMVPSGDIVDFDERNRRLGYDPFKMRTSTSREMRAPGKVPADVVKAMRLYLGSVDYAPPRSQKRLYDRAMKGVMQIAQKYNMDPGDVWQQIESRARSEGIIRPLPGHHL